jgi:outer membrane protein assembly factor BamA
VRWLAIAMALGIVALWVAFRYLPHTEARAAAAIDRPIARLQEVRSVALDGQRLPHARLRDVVATQPGQLLDRARLARDREALEQRLAELGYLAARVAPPFITFDNAGAAYVTFDIDQGEPFHLRTVEVTGAARDAVIVTLTPGDLAVRSRIERARDALTDALDRRTGPRDRPTSVELSVHTDLAAAAVDVTFSTH